MIIRQAVLEDQAWVDEQYQSVDFIPSDVSQHYVLMATWNGVPAALGRLVPLEDGSFEMGGIFVKSDFRKLGIARELVAHLVEKNKGKNGTWCIPFGHLSAFYQSCGFRKALAEDPIPAEIRKKVNWCSDYYSSEVDLLYIP